ncbi:MAG: hypothetical protein LBF19_04175 [Prevotellaceae bacterium]|jgi:hypothetical protein|nr:hypothetical protein [Prevotellaceae bacterium]
MPTRYYIRAGKSVLLFYTIALLAITFIYFTSSAQDRQIDSFVEFLQRGIKLGWMSLFLAVFGLAYPFIGYTRHFIPHANTLTAEEKDTVVAVFANARFTLQQDDGQVLIFRHKNAFTRLMRVYEDAITVDYSGKGLTVEGLRRDADRLARGIEWKLSN